MNTSTFVTYLMSIIWDREYSDDDKSPDVGNFENANFVASRFGGTIEVFELEDLEHGGLYTWKFPDGSRLITNGLGSTCEVD